ncbi:MAG TPA: PfkB family carbohydrate kinase, partial [Erysipelothrix sp.]|nr:PfkB family carbohydrate kinase [Erysipelothrix sp.]
NEIDQLETSLQKITSEDVVIITGRIAEGMPKDWYVKLSQKISDKGARFVVDLDSKDLLKICEYGPLLIKPNIAELESIFDKKLEDEAIIIEHARKLIDVGAQNCIVSLGAKGSLLINKDNVYRTGVPQGTLVSSVGAGDSMVAGFVYEYLKKGDVKAAYKMAAACGSATAYSKHLAKKDMIEELSNQIEIGE